MSTKLLEAVSLFAQQTHQFSEADLDQPWTWRAHDEGVRFAFLGTYHELRDLAVNLAHLRTQFGPPATLVHRALGQYLTAYRDLQAVLLGVEEVNYDTKPAPAEWPLRFVYGHAVSTQTHFFTLVHYGLARQRAEAERPLSLPEGELERVVGARSEFIEMMENGRYSDMRTFYENLHQRTMTEFADMTDAEIMGPSLWWEEEVYSLLYRLQRFDAHLRQHTIQAEKTLAQIGQPISEAKQLLRLIYQALSEVEAALIGAPALNNMAQEELAQIILARTVSVTEVVRKCREMETAVSQGANETLTVILKENPKLVNTLTQNKLPLILTAQYQNQKTIVEILIEAGTEMGIFEAAAIGKLAIVQKELSDYPEDLDENGRDGFTPLQLACFFGHEDIVTFLLAQGANVNAVAQNPMQIQPIHAAAAYGNLSILRQLLEQGADANGRQQNGLTPLHTAAHSNNPQMAQLLLEFGADPSLTDDSGQTPASLAQAIGNEDVLSVLS